jgi:hypothetical protein
MQTRLAGSVLSLAPLMVDKDQLQGPFRKAQRPDLCGGDAKQFPLERACRKLAGSAMMAEAFRSSMHQSLEAADM